MIQFSRIEHANEADPDSVGGLVTKVIFSPAVGDGKNPNVWHDEDEGGDMTPPDGIGGLIEGTANGIAAVIGTIEQRIKNDLSYNQRFVFPVSTQC
jgi:hypothetical protein